MIVNVNYNGTYSTDVILLIFMSCCLGMYLTCCPFRASASEPHTSTFNVQFVCMVGMLVGTSGLVTCITGCYCHNMPYCLIYNPTHHPASVHQVVMQTDILLPHYTATQGSIH